MSAPTVAAFDAVALLESLRGRGATVSIKGTGAAAWLHVAPRGVLSDGERADLRRNKSELLALLARDDAATVAHRWASATGDASATGAAAPDASASATTGSAAAIAPGECAALLAHYRAGGAVLTLERVEHAGAPSLALGIELTARVPCEKRGTREM
jgi:hypothetical protein